MSDPSSVSVRISGFRLMLPSVFGLMAPVEREIENVSYCATVLGRWPALPQAARNFRRLSASGDGNHDSLDAIHAPATRGNVAQRFADPNNELPSRRMLRSRMYRSRNSNAPPARYDSERTSV